MLSTERPTIRLTKRALVDVGDAALADLFAVAQANPIVGDAKNLVELMRDEKHGSAVGLQPRHDAEKLFDFMRRKRRGRFVHDDDAGVVRQRAGDFDKVLLRDAQRLDQGVRAEVGLQRDQQLFGLRRASAVQSTAPNFVVGVWPMKMFSAIDNSSNITVS